MFVLVLGQRYFVIAILYAIATVAFSRPISSAKKAPPAAHLPALQGDASFANGMVDGGKQTSSVGPEIPTKRLNDIGIKEVENSSGSFVNEKSTLTPPTSSTKNSIKHPRKVRSPPTIQFSPCASTAFVPYTNVDTPSDNDEEVEEESVNSSNDSISSPTPRGCTPPKDVMEQVIGDNYENGFGMLAMALSDMAEKYRAHRYSVVESDAVVSSTVCSQMETMLEEIAPTNKTSSCPYQYRCNFDQQRYPKFIIELTCKQKYCSSNCNQLSECKQKSFSLSVARTDNENCSDEEGSSQWTVAPQKINVGCSCGITSIS